MNFKFGLLFAVTFLFLNVSTSSSSNEAINECAKEHNIELSSLSTVNGSFRNGKCMLECTVGSVALPADLMHEGQACPDDSSGLCHQGHCIGGQEEALLECGLEHRVDFHKAADHRGTAFINDQCMLKCVLGGTEMSANHKHEGSKCPTNPNGICRNGLCVTQITNSGTTATQSLPTVTQPSIEPLSTFKMKLLNISLESTDPSLNQNQRIQLWFYETAQSNPILFSFFDGNLTNPTADYSIEISNIPSRINKASQMSIDLLDLYRLTEQKEDIYPLFATFYQNHKLGFGTQENFVAKFPIHRYYSPHEKLMDVTLRFTIVFSKD